MIKNGSVKVVYMLEPTKEIEEIWELFKDEKYIIYNGKEQPDKCLNIQIYRTNNLSLDEAIAKAKKISAKKQSNYFLIKSWFKQFQSSRLFLGGEFDRFPEDTPLKLEKNFIILEAKPGHEKQLTFDFIARVDQRKLPGVKVEIKRVAVLREGYEIAFEIPIKRGD